MAKLGSSFWEEVAEAGLTGLPFGVDMNSGVILSAEGLTPEQRGRLDGVIARHDPKKLSKRMLLQENEHVKQFKDWLPTATADQIDAWVDSVDIKVVLKTIVKSLAAR